MPQILQMGMTLQGKDYPQIKASQLAHRCICMLGVGDAGQGQNLPKLFFQRIRNEAYFVGSRLQYLVLT